MRLRLLLLSGFAALVLTDFAPGTAAAANSFAVSAAGMSAFAIDGANNPTLTLTRGQTYTFALDATTAGHPFWITTARGAGDAEGNAFRAGVTGNGSAPGTVTFAVPASAPPVLFYQCNFHDPMGGTLTIVSPAPAVPAVGPAALAAVAVLLPLAAVALLRRRRARP